MMKPVLDSVAPLQRAGDLGWIYFIQSVTNGPIKIGFSKNVKERIEDIQCGSPAKLTVLAVHPGTRWGEQRLHKQFATDRIRAGGEWFNPSEKLLKYIWKRGQVYNPDSFVRKENKA
jgi:hypothetical protein